MVKKRNTAIQGIRRALRHSLLGAFGGWLSAYSIFIIIFTVQLMSDALSTGDFLQAPTFEWLFIVGAVGVGSCFVTLAGWLFVGLPITILISAQQARSLKCMLTVYPIATVLAVTVVFIFSRLPNDPSATYKVVLFREYSFLTVWAAVTGVIGGAIICALEKRY